MPTYGQPAKQDMRPYVRASMLQLVVSLLLHEEDPLSPSFFLFLRSFVLSFFPSGFGMKNSASLFCVRSVSVASASVCPITIKSKRTTRAGHHCAALLFLLVMPRRVLLYPGPQRDHLIAGNISICNNTYTMRGP